VGDEFETLKNVKFKTKENDLQSYSRKGFVNMIQATDALMARLIVVHAKKLGIKNIISIHDCFRVDIHSTGLLQQAIINAYQELFGSESNESTEHMPCSLDIVAEYFKGALKSTKEEFKFKYTGGMFILKTGYRVCDSINGVSMSSLISQLGSNNHQCFYFAK
jgi:hypothetical protein